MFEIIPEVGEVFEVFAKNGFEAYLVGGCVRDFILGKVPSDFDITTNARPNEMLEIFDGYKVIETGLKHGTVTVVVRGVHLEITTYRFDGNYSDGRHPDEVRFSRTLSDDLQRRDFTVNAMAYNGRLVDLYGGKADIDNKIIRCVGDADKRFKEDALRILRALRFSSKLGFKIEKNTSESILKNKALLHKISGERIYTELIKLLGGKNADKVIREYDSVFEEVFKGSGFALSADTVKACPDDDFIKLAAFFLRNEYCGDNLRRMKVSNKCYHAVLSVTEITKQEIHPTASVIKRLMNKYGSDSVYGALLLKRANGDKVDTLLDIYREITDKNECFCLSQLAVCGNDLINAGISGKAIGEVLKALLEMVIEGSLENKKDVLLEYIKENRIEKTY